MSKYQIFKTLFSFNGNATARGPVSPIFNEEGHEKTRSTVVCRYIAVMLC